MIPILAQIAGYAAMATIFASFQVKDSRGTLWVMGAATGLFSIHFALLGAFTGAILNALNVVRNLAILFTDPQKPLGKGAMHVISLAYTAAPFVFLLLPGANVGLQDYVLGVVMTVCAYLFWSKQSKLIRLSQFFLISPAWIVYNAIAHSIPGVLTECLNLTSVAIFWLREFLGKSKKTTETKK